MKKAIVPLGIILLVIFGVFMYLNRFTIFHVSDVDGYVFNTNNIAANLSAGLTENSEKITYENVKVSDTIYQSGKKHYIGEEEKKQVNIEYPIVSEDTSSVYVLNDTGKFVDQNFIKETTYKNTILTDGYLYNGVNLERASDEKYYFLELSNGIFVNLVELNVKRAGGNNIIPVNSFIYFEQSFLRYYSLENKQYVYHEMPNISDSTKTLVGEDEYTYYDLLIFLEVISKKEDKIEEVIEEIELEPEKPQVINPSTTTPNQGLVGGETPSGGHIVEEEYVKPVVTLENTRTGVYSFGGDLSIYDPTSRIYKTPTLEYKYKGIVYMRSSFNKAARVETTGLMPSTVYEVTGYYYYHDEYQQKMKNTFFQTEIVTGDISSLETLDMTINGITAGVSDVKIDQIKLNNPTTDEVLKGLKSGSVLIDKANIGLSAGDMKKLIAGSQVDFKTDAILKSNTTYNGYIEFKDLAGNVMKVKNNTFNFTTRKSPPKGSVLAKLSKNFTVADMEIKISNPDSVNVLRYEYFVYDSNGTLLDASKNNGNGMLLEGTNNIQLKNLYAEQLYKVRVLADYIDQDGETKNDYVLDDYEFITFDVDRLGSIPFTVTVPSVSQAGATIKMAYTNYDETNPIYELISPNVEIIISDKLDPEAEPTVLTYNKSQFMNSGITIDLNASTGFYIKTDTVYQIDIVPYIMSGDQRYDVETTLTTKEFQTLKDDAQVFIKNGFVSEGYIDFDVCILDEDGTIDGDDVTVNFTDSNNKIAFSKSVKKRTSCTTPAAGETQNDIYTRISAKGLEAKDYELSFKVAKYNIGHMDSTLKTNYSIRTETIKATGTTGTMRLNSLINMINYETTLKDDDGSEIDSIVGVNLFDISNNTRWKSAGGTNTSDLKEIKVESDEVVLQTVNGWRRYSYYLPELENKAYFLSFEFEYTPGTTNHNGSNPQQICLNFTDDTNDCIIPLTSDLVNKKGERLVYSIKPILDDGRNIKVGKYLTFFINEIDGKTLTTTLKLKNVKIEIGTTGATGYSDFGEKADGAEYTTKYAGDFFADFNNIITDKKIINAEAGTELNFNELNYSYVIRYFKNGEEVPELQTTIEYDRVDELTHKLTTYIYKNYILTDIDSDEDFEARLSVKAELGASGGGSEEEPAPETPEEPENPDAEPEEPDAEPDDPESEPEEPEEEVEDESEVRYYDLAVVEFTTEAETRTISSVEQFQQMHMYGYYLVSEDLDFTNASGYSTTFQGSIDFQGHKVTSSLKNAQGGTSTSYIFHTIGGGAVVKNVDFHVNLNDDSLRRGYYGLVYRNYGLISNLNITVDTSVQPYRIRQVYKQDEEGNNVLDYEYSEETGHEYFAFLGEENYGIVENFVINFNAPMYCKEDCTAGSIVNRGTYKNGYVIGKNIKAGYTNDGNSKDVGLLAVSTSTNSKIENIYSLVDIELSSSISTSVPNDYTVGNIAASASSAEISNVIMVDPRIVHQNETGYNYATTYRDYNKDVAFSSRSSTMVEDVYYISNFNYNNVVTQEAVISHLSNESFMSARLNSEYQFNTVESWHSKTFPHLLWPEYMPAQKVINIPTTNTSGYFKILSIDEVIQDKNDQKFKDAYKDDYFARVTMSVYNPKSMRLAGFAIQDIGSSANPLEITIDSQPSNNSDKIAIVTFYVKEPKKFKTKYQITDVFLNNLGGTNTVIGTTKSCTNGKMQGDFDCTDMPVLNLDLYKYVSTLDEIKTAQSQGHENFRLSKDIIIENGNPYLPTVKGVLDGNGFEIRTPVTAKEEDRTTLQLNNCFIGELSGTIKNLNINKVNINHTSTNAGYGAFICKSKAGSIVDNVHIKDITTTAGGANTLYISGLIANAANTKVRNSSVSDIRINNIPEMQGKNAYGGGLIGYSSNTNVTNSFVRNIDYQLESYVAGDAYTDPIYGVSQFLATGGIVGQMEAGIIENVYATGTIQTKFGNVGGIVGQTNGYVRSAITKVNIYSSGDKLGGIVGFVSSENTNLISKTLVMGDVLSSADSAPNLDRTSGTKITPNQNFAWNRQAINSIVSANTKMEELLDETELANPVIYNNKIGISEYDFAVGADNYLKKYDATGKNLIPETRFVKNQETGVLEEELLTFGIIPKILHTSTGQILNNQDADDDTIIEYVELFSLMTLTKPQYMSTNGTDDMQDDFSVVDAWDGEYVNITMVLKNVNDRPVTGIEIEDMDLIGSIQPDWKEGSGVVTITMSAKASLNKNYDSYRITKVYYTDTKNKTQAYNTSIKLTIPFYGRIDEASDWQKIKPGTYQNFVLAKDIDLSSYDKNTANYNLSFNQLVGIDQVVTDAKGVPLEDENGNIVKRAPIISGVTLTELGPNTGLIDTIQSEIRNISFKDISLTARSNASGNYFGVIKFLNGTMKGSLDQATGTYKRMVFENITLNGQTNVSYVGIVALNKSPDIHYIEFNNVYAKGKTYVAGLIAYSYALNKTDIVGSNIYAYSSASYAGGFLGYEPDNTSKRFTFNVTIRGVYIYSNNEFAGGVFARGSGQNIYVYGSEEEKFGVVMNQVYSKNYYTGGVAGRYSSHNNNNNHAYDLNITGKYYVGGVCGYRYHLYNCLASNCNVSGTGYVGGVSGWAGYTVYYSTFAGGSIKGNYYVGGICGGISSGGIRYCHVGQHGNQTTIEGTGSNPHGIGGIVGYVNTGANYIYYNSVSANIIGSYDIGGIAGFFENKNESKSGSQHYLQDNMVQNCTITSTHATTAFTGGLIGRVQRNFPYNYVYDNIISAEIITATPDYTGYVIGGSDYSYTTPIKDQDGNVTGQLLFDFNEKNGDKFLWQESNGTITTQVKRIKLYENSTLNGVKYKDLAAEEKVSENSLTTMTFDQMATWSTYTGIISTSYMQKSAADTAANRTTGLEYFPLAKAELATNYPNSLSYNLPGEGEGGTSAHGGMYHILPDFKVYAVDVDKINIEFAQPDPATKLTVNGQSYTVDDSVFTFYYDFKEDFEVKVSDIYNEKIVKVTADEVKNGVTVLGEYFYYLKDGEVITNNVKNEKIEKEESEDSGYEADDLIEIPNQNQQTQTQEKEEPVLNVQDTTEQQNENTGSEPVSSENIIAYVANNLTSLAYGVNTPRMSKNMAVSDTEDNTIKVVNNATNIYGDEVLLEDKSIYNIETGQTYDNQFENLTLAPTTSLHEYTYANQRVETFYYHTLINGKRVDKQVYVKNGQIEIVATEIDNQKNQILVDNYNDKNYLIYLGGDGKLYSIKDDIVFPKGFKNINIRSISSNADSNTDLLFVEYNDGSYTVFNYRTGQLIQKQSDENISLEDYIKQYLEISFDTINEPANKKYADAKKLVGKLQTKPLSSFNNEGHSGGTLDSTKYSIVYDPTSGEYYVYEIPGADDSGLVSLSSSLEKSVDSIIDSNPAMIEYYREGEGTRVSIVSAILIVLGIVMGIAGAVLILGKNVKKDKGITKNIKEAKA